MATMCLCITYAVKNSPRMGRKAHWEKCLLCLHVGVLGLRSDTTWTPKHCLEEFPPPINQHRVGEFCPPPQCTHILYHTGCDSKTQTNRGDKKKKALNQQRWNLFKHLARGIHSRPTSSIRGSYFSTPSPWSYSLVTLIPSSNFQPGGLVMVPADILLLPPLSRGISSPGVFSAPSFSSYFLWASPDSCSSHKEGSFQHLFIPGLPVCLPR